MAQPPVDPCLCGGQSLTPSSDGPRLQGPNGTLEHTFTPFVVLEQVQRGLQGKGLVVVHGVAAMPVGTLALQPSCYRFG